ncbi:MAG: hypothetical protein J5556_07435, partial [Deltaproteobacteria bacterium]|nr:hypothetical protein [Deltaproteobacteria bacterium]
EGGTSYRYFPFVHEAEGLSFWGEKLLTTSRYLFAKAAAADSAKSLCRWNGEVFVYANQYSLSLVGGVITRSDGTVLDSVPLPSNIKYWAPTSFTGGTGWTIPDFVRSPTGADRLLHERGDTVFHHYVIAYQQAEGSAEEWGLNKDVFKWPSTRYEVNPVISRKDFAWAFNLLNTHKSFPMMFLDQDGSFCVYNARDIMANPAMATIFGGKTYVTDNSGQGKSVSFGTTLGRTQYSINFDATGQKAKLYVNGVDVLTLYGGDKLLTRGNLYPVANNADSLGIAAKAWANVYTKELTLNGRALSSTIGTLANLTTTDKSSLVSAINELAARVAALENAASQ